MRSSSLWTSIGRTCRWSGLGVLATSFSLCSIAADWPDALVSTPGTPENIAKGQETDAYTLGVSAYVWGYPLVRMERVAREYTDVPNPKPATSYRAPLNQIGWARELATPAALDMPTANNDTAYLSAVVDLSKEPYVLTVPDTNDRYYVVDLFNMWQELEQYIGRRVTGTKAGKFAIVPPGWNGKLPADVKRLDVTTSKVWLWGRIRVSADEDIAKVHALQDGFDLRPLSALGNANWKTPAATLPALPDIGKDPLGFYTHLGAALKANTIKPADKALAAQFERIGLTAQGFDPSKLNDAQRKGLKRAIQDGPLVAVSGIVTSSVRREGWDYVRGLDDFGFNYPLRALVAGPYLGGQGEKEAVYPIRYTDSAGKPLTGAGTYTVKFSPEPPNDAFWSLTMYDAKTKMLVSNPIKRYKIGNDTPGLVRGADGSVAISISAKQPASGDKTNWLPAPKGAFYLLMRIYQPKPAVFDGSYKFPQVEAVK
ncbi:DUF1254 domain-containing protein [Uliginosibacterium sp. H3]|uniref:DUF1254 domain-containing protein n=1 Tax=Uliginosibacterium silvisoli TaxID=3114758 RepID=A0ABU6K1K0_9RHOO|nr:DUF1254 domain-containing protein [Uliginosibacterium sp. H3]